MEFACSPPVCVRARTSGLLCPFQDELKLCEFNIFGCFMPENSTVHISLCGYSVVFVFFFNGKK